MSSKLCLALIGDMINSKQVSKEERWLVQEKLEEILDKVNTNYSNYIVSKFLITLGDEFQGLLKANAPIYEIICTIIEGINPPQEERTSDGKKKRYKKEKLVQFRFGLGFGHIFTEIKEEALGMDGPAFYLARSAIKEAHNRRNGHAIVFRAEDGVLPPQGEETIRGLLELLAIIRKYWIDKFGNFQNMLPYLRKEITQKDIANLLGTQQPFISRQVANAYWLEFKEIEKGISKLLIPSNWTGNNF